MTIEREKLKVKTIESFLVGLASVPGEHVHKTLKGDVVRITDGAFKGMVGTVIELDGEWRTVEVEMPEFTP